MNVARKVHAVETKAAMAAKLFKHTTDDGLKRAFRDALRDMADTRPRTLSAMHEEVNWYHKLRDEMHRRGLSL